MLISVTDDFSLEDTGSLLYAFLMWLLLYRADGGLKLEMEKEHQWYVRLGQLEKSALAEHSSNINHEILFSVILFHSDVY